MIRDVSEPINTTDLLQTHKCTHLSPRRRRRKKVQILFVGAAGAAAAATLSAIIVSYTLWPEHDIRL